jgi:hypothetical protein
MNRMNQGEMIPAIILLASGKNDSDENFSKFLDFLGIQYVKASTRETLLHHIEGGTRCLAASSHAIGQYKDIEDELYDKISYMLIYEADSTQTPVSSSVIISDQKDICRELSGLSFMPDSEFIFTLNEGTPNIQKLISINGNASFAVKQRGNCRIFLLPVGIIDIKRKISGKLTRDDSLLKIAPVAMFLRYIFPECFAADVDRYACLIIDDPLLKESYGFIDYYKLLELMDVHNFFTTIALIPLNYKRTDKKIAALFKQRPDRFSVCVHGCDHTEGEFGKKDPDYFNGKIRLSTARMIEHEKITGIPYDHAMVFPQGVFSIEAMEALKANHYLAAVNSVLEPVNGSDYLEVSDYLQCNIMKYGNFPLFVRRLPESLIDFAFDFFWGKPVFMVIHNDYLRNGYEKLIACIVQFNSLSENIKWKSVGDIIDKFVMKSNVDNDIADIDLSGFRTNGFSENVRILIRRYAFECRDNYLCRNDMLLNFATKLKNLIIPFHR